MRRPSVIALIAITIVFVASTLPVNARSSGQGKGDLITVIAIDSGAAPAPADLDMTETALMTLTGSIEEGQVAIYTYGSQPSSPVSAPAGAEAVTAARAAMSGVRTGQGALKSDQVSMLTTAFSYLTREDAVPGSRVILITPGRISGESENTSARLVNIAGLYSDEGWAIDVTTAPSSEFALREMLNELAQASGGKYFDLGTPEGLQALLLEAAGVNLDTVIDAELAGSQLSSTFEVAPLTDSISMAFLRFDPSINVALFRPNGAQVSSLSANVDKVESPNVVIYNISDPAPGTWSAEGLGQRGKLLAGVDKRSRVSLQLVDQPALPVGEPGLLTAAAMLGGEPQAVPGARIQATVRLADGFTNVYELNDGGVAGDATAGDGVYTVRVPSPETQGINDVSLLMSWDNLKAQIAGSGSYKTEVFPGIRVTRMYDVKLYEGEEGTVATIETFVGEFPYLASPDEFKVQLIGSNGPVEGHVVPVTEPEPGKGYVFDVVARAPSSGDYSVSLSLDTDYLGRTYKAVGPAITTKASVSGKPFLILGLKLWMWAGIIVAVAGGLAVVIVLSRRTQPYGFIYDDQDNLVVDFAGLRRSWLRKLTATDRVEASEIGNLPFHLGVFRFTQNGVTLEYNQQGNAPSLRVNSRPAAPVVDLDVDVWLGISGKLFTFTGERRPSHSFVFAPGDD
jgi:hypothetical protein